MHRSSTTRNVLIGSLSVILLMVVLYYMKRVEAGRIKHDMVVMSVSWREEWNRNVFSIGLLVLAFNDFLTKFDHSACLTMLTYSYDHSTTLLYDVCACLCTFVPELHNI